MKAFNHTHHQENTNQNHHDISPHICSSRYFFLISQCWRSCGEIRTFVHLLTKVENDTGSFSSGNSHLNYYMTEQPSVYLRELEAESQMCQPFCVHNSVIHNNRARETIQVLGGGLETELV